MRPASQTHHQHHNLDSGRTVAAQPIPVPAAGHPSVDVSSLNCPAGGNAAGRAHFRDEDAPRHPGLARDKRSGARHAIMQRLAAARGAVVTIEALVFAVYGAEREEPARAVETIRVLIMHLRQRLGCDAILTEHGVGYRMPVEIAAKIPGLDDAHVVLARSEADERRFNARLRILQPARKESA